MKNNKILFLLLGMLMSSSMLYARSTENTENTENTVEQQPDVDKQPDVEQVNENPEKVIKKSDLVNYPDKNEVQGLIHGLKINEYAKTVDISRTYATKNELNSYLKINDVNYTTLANDLKNDEEFKKIFGVGLGVVFGTNVATLVGAVIISYFLPQLLNKTKLGKEVSEMEEATS